MASQELPPVPFADPHCHYWSPKTHQWLDVVKNDPSHPFHKFAPLARPYFPAEHKADLAGVDLRESVYIQANMHAMGGFSPVEEVAFCAGMAAGAGGNPNGIVGWAPLDKPDEAAAVLDACLRYDGYRGVRFMLDFHPTRPELCQTDRGDYMTDPAFLDGVKLLGARGLLFELQVCQVQLAEAAAFATACPDVSMVLNHAGFPLRGEYDAWRAGLDALAACPNVAVKMGGFGTYDSPGFSPEETKKYVDACIEAFGVARCMFASNLPVDLIDAVPAERWASYWAAVKDRPIEDATALFRGNALRVYRLG